MIVTDYCLYQGNDLSCDRVVNLAVGDSTRTVPSSAEEIPGICVVFTAGN